MYSLLLFSSLASAYILECRKRDLLTVIGSNPDESYTVEVLTSAVKMPDFVNELFSVVSPSFAIGGKIVQNGVTYGFVQVLDGTNCAVGAAKLFPELTQGIHALAFYEDA